MDIPVLIIQYFQYLLSIYLYLSVSFYLEFFLSLWWCHATWFTHTTPGIRLTCRSGDNQPSAWLWAGEGNDEQLKISSSVTICKLFCTDYSRYKILPFTKQNSYLHIALISSLSLTPLLFFSSHHYFIWYSFLSVWWSSLLSLSRRRESIHRTL